MATVVKIARWLLSHREQALQIYELTKAWSTDLTLEERWKIVDSVARIVLPLFEEGGVLAFDADSFDYEDDVELMALGADVSALGIPWIAVTSVIIPVLQIVFDFIQREAKD